MPPKPVQCCIHYTAFVLQKDAGEQRLKFNNNLIIFLNSLFLYKTIETNKKETFLQARLASCWSFAAIYENYVEQRNSFTRVDVLPR